MRKLKVALEYEDDGRISAHCLDLPGCHSWGETREEALENIKEAIAGYLEVLEERNREYQIEELVEVDV